MLGNIVVKNVSAGDKIEVTLVDDRFQPLTKTVEAQSTVVITVVPYFVVKLALKNQQGESISSISGVVYINDVNQGLIESAGGVMLKFFKNTNSMSNKVVLDLSDLSSIYKPVKKEYTNVASMLDETIVFERNMLTALFKFEDTYKNPASLA